MPIFCRFRAVSIYSQNICFCHFYPPQSRLKPLQGMKFDILSWFGPSIYVGRNVSLQGMLFVNVKNTAAAL